MAVDRIIVAATIINGAGARRVSLADPKKTNISVYLGNSDTSLEWVADYSANAFNPALVAAAKLSMKHGVPIMPVHGLED